MKLIFQIDLLLITTLMAILGSGEKNETRQLIFLFGCAIGIAGFILVSALT